MIKEAGEPPTVLGPEEGGGPAAAIPPVLDGLEWLQLQDLSLVVGEKWEAKNPASGLFGARETPVMERSGWKVFRSFLLLLFIFLF